MRTLAQIAVAVLAVAVSACGGDDSSRAAEPSERGSSGSPGTATVLIVLQLDLPDGQVLPESRLGDAPFCRGGTTSDAHGGTPGLGLVVTTFDCPEGGLQITFSPTQDSLTQSSEWRVVDGSGTGTFAGLRASGQMRVQFEEADRDMGRSTFTGAADR